MSPLKRRVVSKGGTFLTNRLLGTKLSDMTSGYQLFRREVLEGILARGIQSRGHFFQTEMKVYAHQWEITEVPIHYRAASPSVNAAVINDAFSHLIRLFKMRVRGELRIKK